MKKIFQLFACGSVLFLLAGCFSARNQVLKNKNFTGDIFAPYSGLKAKITVSDFELKTAGLDAQTGLALKEYFISILESTQRFMIVNPQEVDLIISVGVDEFVPESSGGKSGVAGGGSSRRGFMGGLLGDLPNTANMQLSLRIVNRASSEVISSRNIQSQAAQTLGMKIKTPGDRVFKTGLSEYIGKPMGKVIQDCLTEGARYTAQNVPLEYYKY